MDEFDKYVIKTENIILSITFYRKYKDKNALDVASKKKYLPIIIVSVVIGIILQIIWKNDLLFISFGTGMLLYLYYTCTDFIKEYEKIEKNYQSYRHFNLNKFNEIIVTSDNKIMRRNQCFDITLSNEDELVFLIPKGSKTLTSIKGDANYSEADILVIESKGENIPKWTIDDLDNRLKLLEKNKEIELNKNIQKSSDKFKIEMKETQELKSLNNFYNNLSESQTESLNEIEKEKEKLVNLTQKVSNGENK